MLTQLPLKVARWDQVINIPEESKITVFNKGKPQGSRGIIPFGGQTPPISIDGVNIPWKKAQKNEKKNIISEVINKHIPKQIPLWTFFVWYPSKVASSIISRNHLLK